MSFYFFVQSNLDEFKENLTLKISEQFEKKVKIENIEAQWRITNPSLTLYNLSIYNESLEKSFDLKKIRIDISWLSLLKFEPILDEIVLYEPNLDIEKHKDKQYSVGGISIKTKQNSSASNWILNQDEIIIINGKIKWRDHTRNAPPLLIENITANYESLIGLSKLGRHKFNISGQLVNLNNQVMSLSGYFDSSSIKDIKNSNGQLSVSVAKIDINELRPWIDYPIEILSANGNINLKGDFNAGKITSINTQLDVKNFVTKINEADEPLTLKKFKGQISYLLNKDISSLNISRMNVITDNGINIEDGELLLSINTSEKKLDEIGIKLNRINLESAHEIIRHIPYTKSIQSLFQEISPKGQFRDLILNWKYSENTLKGFSVSEKNQPITSIILEDTNLANLMMKGQLLNVSFNSYKDFPGIKNLTGLVNIKKTGGTIKSVSKDLTIIKDNIFRQPLKFSQFSGLIEWKNNLFNLKNIVIQNDDINSIINGSYKYIDHQNDFIDLSIKLPSLSLPSLQKYYPKQLGKKTLHWLDTSLLKGQAQNTFIRIKGKSKEFPFVNNKNEADTQKGIFTVESDVINSFIEYGIGWPELNNFDFQVNVKNNTIEFTSNKGDLLQNNIQKMSATISPMNIEYPIMEIDLILDSPIPKIVNAINKSPIKKVMKGLFDEMKGEGPGKLAVKLQIPLKDEDNITFKGNYEFQNSYLINDSLGMPKIENIFGYVEFDQNNIEIKEAKATILDSPIKLSLNNLGDITQVNIDGIINEDFFRSTFGDDWANKLIGEASWFGEIKIKDKTTDIMVSSDLKGLQSDLPLPFNKDKDEVKTFLFTKQASKVNQEIIKAEISTIVFAKLIKEIDANGKMEFKNGLISINSPQKKLPEQGILLFAELSEVNFENFNSLFNNLGTKSLITSADIDINELDIFGYKILNSNIRYLPSSDKTNIQIKSDDVLGNILWNQNENLVKAGFEKLHLKKNNALIDNDEEKFIFSDPPIVNIKAKSLKVDDYNYGSLSLNAYKENKIWNIENFKINNPSHKISGSGFWDDEGLNPNTSINFTWNIDNIQKTFDQLSYPELIKDGKASVIGLLSWPNSPFDFDSSQLQGNFSLTANDGIVLEAKPGVARLFGLLTLQNLPRRLSLDFSAIFSKGFIFDRINAGVIVNKGILKSNRFTMEGPAAEVSIKGETNIIEETQNIHVVVNPRISDSLSLLSLAGGPLAGAAAFVAQKILKDPLNKIMSDEYQIIGTWDEPEEISTPRGERFGKMIDQEILEPSSEFLNIK